MVNVPRKIWDISPPVDEHAEMFPGDTLCSQRILLRTSRSASRSWASLIAKAQETIAQLATKKVALVGIDTPSVNPAHSRSLPSQHRLLANDMHVLECRVIDNAPEGDHELIALPLKQMRPDASPVRAILREL